MRNQSINGDELFTRLGHDPYFENHYSQRLNLTLLQGIAIHSALLRGLRPRLHFLLFLQDHLLKRVCHTALKRM